MHLLPHSIPALLIGLIVAGYWARVLRLVHKSRRHAGHGANFVPREGLGRILRIVWYPVVALWIAHPFVTAFRSHLPAAMRPLATVPLLGWGAVILGAGAMAGTLVCWKRMGRSWRMGIDPDEKTQLIVSGPYAFVRHPIYALSSVLMLASVAVIPSPLMVGVGLTHLLLLQWEARREEKYLLSVHGPAYADYRASVGRFVPRSLVRYAPDPRRASAA